MSLLQFDEIDNNHILLKVNKYSLKEIKDLLESAIIIKSIDQYLIKQSLIVQIDEEINKIIEHQTKLEALERKLEIK